MDKVLVEVYVPVLEKTLDIFIPLQSPMHQVLGLIKKAVAEEAGSRLQIDEETALCHREDGTIININLSVYELGIRNGAKLMLI